MKNDHELELLFSISQILDRNPDIQLVIYPVLQTVCEYFDSPRGMITILNKSKNDIQIEEAYGLTDLEKTRTRYNLGEGIIGTVISTGISRLIPSVAHEPAFLNKTKSRLQMEENLAFICAPIKIEGDPIGAIAIDEYQNNKETLEQHLRLLSVISSLVTQAIRLRQRITEDREQLLQENKRLRAEISDKHKISNFIGNAASMSSVFEKIAFSCRSDSPVYLTGESGTGKNYLAHIIHHNSDRSDHAFIYVPAQKTLENNLEERLFGSADTAGLLKNAHLGTLYIDEISSMSPIIQEKLFNFFRSGTLVNPVTNECHQINTRIFASDVYAESDQGPSTLLPSLQDYFSSIHIPIPPLRNRKSDIPLLANHFVSNLYEKHFIPIKRISSSAIDLLINYHWPGNVRELSDTLELASLKNTEGVIHPHHLPPTLQSAESTKTAFSGSLQELMDTYEASIIQDALKISRGSISTTAKLLKISHRILRLRIAKHSIDTKQFKTK